MEILTINYSLLTNKIRVYDIYIYIDRYLFDNGTYLIFSKNSSVAIIILSYTSLATILPVAKATFETEKNKEL